MLAHQHPEWRNAEIARQVGCSVNTVKLWRPRWRMTDSLKDAPRAGARRRFTPLQRAQIIALACSSPRQAGKPWMRWSGEKLAEVAIEQQIVESISPGTVRTWLRQDEIKPWRYHSWQHSHGSTATRNPLRFLGESAAWGTVDQGKVANLILLDANWLEGVRNTQRRCK